VTTIQAIQWFGGRKKMSDALCIWPHATYRWGEFPPKLRQYEMESLSDGELKVDG
jgi:hypothetical protein